MNLPGQEENTNPMQSLVAMLGGTDAPPKPKDPRDEYAKPEPDELAKKWKKKIAAASEHWKKFHQRVRHNRKVVAGFDWSKDPTEKDFYLLRANLIQGTITAVLPNIYARNPEISAVPEYTSANLKLMCKTIETVTNKTMTKAQLKTRAKATVRAALTCSFGVLKLVYQRSFEEDPNIRGRMNDTQDNIAHLEQLIREVDDPQARGDAELKKAELNNAMAAMKEKVEIVSAEGLVIDRVLTENLLLDPAIQEFDDYINGEFMAEKIPMRKSAAEAKFKMCLDGATAYEHSKDKGARNDGRLASGSNTTTADPEICIVEVWDKVNNQILTLVEGCEFFAKPPFVPKKLGERWYPYFLLPFQKVDGTVIGPSLVDLTERLQEEHNDTRESFNKHRKLAQPGYIAGSDTTEKTLKSFTHAEFGEIIIVDPEGKPLSQVIVPKQHPAIDPQVYDTAVIRSDWEQTTGLQDAARSTVVKPKTATEANIMQQSLSGRVSEFRDSLEDFIQEMSQYGSQICLLEMTDAQVSRIMGPHQTVTRFNPATMAMETVIVKPSYDWPKLNREEVFDMISMDIRAGTTGAPDKLEQQESWIKLMPVIQPLIDKIGQVRAMGGNADPYVALLRETLSRFDDRLDIEQFLPQAPPAMPGMPGMPGQAGPGMPGAAMPAGPMAAAPAGPVQDPASAQPLPHTEHGGFKLPEMPAPAAMAAAAAAAQ